MAKEKDTLGDEDLEWVNGGNNECILQQCQQKNYKEEYKEEQLKGWGGREVHRTNSTIPSPQISHDLCPLDCLKSNRKSKMLKDNAIKLLTSPDYNL